MRKLAVIGIATVISISLTGTLYSQQKEIDKKDVPPEIVQKIESDYLSCGDNISWYVTGEGDIDYYVANATGKNMTCEAVYDKNGNLVYAVTIQTNFKLPEIVMETIANKYNGWNVTGDKRVIRNFDKNMSHMEIKIENEDESKTLYFDSNGEEISPQLALFSEKTKVKKKEVPETVSETIETDFLSCKENITWYKYDRSKEPDHYVVTASGKGLSCRAVYDKRGNLISSKTIAENVKLPRDIQKFIYTKYPEWTITKDKSIVTDFDEVTKYYEVIIEKNGSIQTLYFDVTGKEIEPPNT